MRSNPLTRTRILIFGLFLIALCFAGKLFYVQVVYSARYSERADRQYATPSENIFERGTIFFTRKDGTLVSAAMQTSGFKLAIDPGKIVDAGIIDVENIYEKLNAIVPIDKEGFLAKSAKINDPYEEVGVIYF